jgi:hypothetical protein
MNLHTEQIIKWFTTPKELRMIAKKMEQKFPELTCGDSTRIYILYGEELKIEIHADQGEFERDKRKSWS